MTDCVIWHKSVGGPGYGQTFYKGKFAYAHRVAWEKANGPIPAGMCVHHVCGNRRCVNVAHLEILSRQDHLGAGGHGKLTQADADEIRSLVASGQRRRDVAAKFGIGYSYVGDIVRGEAWAKAA